MQARRSRRHNSFPASPVVGPITVERLERALLILAYIMEKDGAVHVPMYERLERELEALKKTEAALDRARQRLANITDGRLAELGLQHLRKSK